MAAPPKPKYLIEYIPLADWAWREIMLYGLPLVAATIAVGWPGPPWCWVATIPALALLVLLWFFRDPLRRPIEDAAAYLAPADGKVVEITSLEQYDFIGGPAIRISIFLSLFDAHINRASRAGRVSEMHYEEGAFRDARTAESAEQNEFLWIGFEELDGRRHALRQVAGAVARRIVSTLQPGEDVTAGEKIGMIKFGSRTELIVPADRLLTCKVGDRVKAGLSVLARAE